MTELIVATVIVAILTVVFTLAHYHIEWDDVLGLIAWLFGLTTLVLSICLALMGHRWTSAEITAKVLNREYKTEYTKDEIFYASDVIDKIRELDRKRIEINGNIMKGEK